jgi:tetratricopeptide (TPR) repeat protein
LHPAISTSSEPPPGKPLQQDSSERARQYKQSADAFLKSDDIEKAADAYIQALDLNKDAFSTAERVQMATRLSWADRLERAEKELRDVLAVEPNNLEARIQLARVLSWRDKLTDAVHEAEAVLKQAPDNREALQIKADALQWKGDLRRAIPIYEQLIQKEDNFDARLGLSYSLLYAGNRTAAEESRQMLKPSTGNQQERLSKFQDTFEGMTRPKLDLQYLYFNDSDGNLLDRYGIAQGFWLGNFDMAANFRHTEARDDTQKNRAEEFSLRAYTNPNELFGVGGRLGLTQTRAGNTSNFGTGEIKLDAKISNGSLGASVTREVLTDSAELIENRIRATIAGLKWSQQLTERFSVHPSYWYRSFSDVNHAHDAQFTSQYLLLFNPKVAVGYRFRYVNFNRQSGGAYFDPSDYYSNRGFISFYLDRPRFYFFSDIFAGQQAFRRNGVRSKDPVYGGTGSIGYRPIRNLVLEFSIEGGQLATGTASTGRYSYLVLGPRLIVRF